MLKIKKRMLVILTVVGPKGNPELSQRILKIDQRAIPQEFRFSLGPKEQCYERTK